MINIYYVAASGSVSSSATVIQDSIFSSNNSQPANNGNQIYTDVLLEITASAYETSGSIFNSTVGDLRVYLKSGSAIYFSAPLDNVSIFYQPYLSSKLYSDSTQYPSLNPTQSKTNYTTSLGVSYIFQPTFPLSSSDDRFIITGSLPSEFESSSINLTVSQSYVAGNIFLYPNISFTAILSGSGLFYTSSLTLINTSTNLTSSYITSSNSYISTSFTISNYNSYQLLATTQATPYIGLTYNSAANIPIIPTSSLDAWNTYLNITASSIVNSGSSVYLLGGNIPDIYEFIITDSGSNLTNFSSFGLNNLVYLYLYQTQLSSTPNLNNIPSIYNVYLDGTSLTGSINNLNYTSSQNLISFVAASGSLVGNFNNILSSFPSNIQLLDFRRNNITGSTPVLSGSLIQTLGCEYNQLSGSISPFTSASSLNYFNCSHNALTGSIPSLSDAVSLYSFHCYYNKLSGSTPDLSNNFILGYFNCSNNQMSGSISNLSSSLYSSSLFWFDCSYNALTGSIPNLSNNKSLTNFYCNNNKLTTYVSASSTNSYFPSTLLTFNANTNQFTTASVDSILHDFRYAGGISGTLDISGSGNAAPSILGNEYKAYLINNRGWTIYTN